jgi:sulfide:quinone oxidoreductase
MRIVQITPFLSVGPQPTAEELKSLRERGFHAVISNRPDGEEPGQLTAGEAGDIARASGLKFAHVPVAVGNIPDEAVAAFADALKHSRGPVFAFCKSGTRSTMLWALSVAARLDPDAILKTATASGYDLAKLKSRLDGLWHANDQ